MMKPMELEKFLELSSQEVADIVQTSNTKVCVFPFNGTRRWFLLEHAHTAQQNQAQAYIEATTEGYIRLFQMLFEHGFETVIAPVFGSEILRRGPEYMSQIGASMGLLADHPKFTSFYTDYDVRVHFYGDYRKEFSGTPYHSIIEKFDGITAQTSTNRKHSLLYGVFASDATEAIAQLSVQFYETHRRPPTRKELIETYYGEYIERADLFIGFEKFSAFDYPMLNWGEESLYFTVAPSLYMTQTLLRKILYDHIFLRPLPEPDYSQMPRQVIDAMRKTYNDKRNAAFGVGQVIDGIWYAETS